MIAQAAPVALAAAPAVGNLAKKLLALAALVVFGALIILAALVSSITNNNNGVLLTGPQYVVTGSVMPPANLEAVFEAAAAADGYDALSVGAQVAIRNVARSTGTSMPCVLPWQLLSAESYVESTYHTTSVSGAGAEGIMQFEPGTFQGYEAMVSALDPSGGASPPSPYDAPDAIYAADMLLCGDGATAGPWSVGDIQAVGQYNCGGTWITDPSACSYGGFTTEDYVNKVHAVFDAILAKAPLGTSTPPTTSNPNTPAPSAPTTPAPAPAQPSNPFLGSIASSASELLGQQVAKDSTFIYGVCQLASNGSSLPPPTGPSSLTDLSSTPTIGDFAITPYGLGVVISTDSVAVVRNDVVASVTPPKNGWSYGIDPAYT